MKFNQRQRQQAKMRAVKMKLLTKLIIHNKKRYSVLLGALTLLVCTQGCSTPEAPIHYYSLNTIHSNNTIVGSPKDVNNSSAELVIRDVEMADFLKTGSLVMQVGAHQIQLSELHRWADKLPRAITLNLIKHMSQSQNNVAIFTKRDLTKQQKTNNIAKRYIVDVFFEQFTLSTDHQTVISGSYTLQTTSTKTRHYFNIRQPLTQDGYDNAVQQFQYSLNALSEKILSELPN